MRIPRVIFTWWSTKRSSIAREHWRLTGRQVSVRPWQQQTWVSTIPCCRSGFRTALSILKLQVSEGDGGNKLVNHKGKVSQVASVHDELLDWVEEYRVNGFSLSKKMLVFQATRLMFLMFLMFMSLKAVTLFEPKPNPNVALVTLSRVRFCFSIKLTLFAPKT